MARRETERLRTLEDLAGQSGVSARNIRFYIARGLLAPPRGAGRAAAYGPEHLQRLKAIRELQAQGLTLAEIGWKLNEAAAGPVELRPAGWLSYELSDDIKVFVRSGISPWRHNRLRALLGRMAAQLNSDSETKGDGHDESRH